MITILLHQHAILTTKRVACLWSTICLPAEKSCMCQAMLHASQKICEREALISNQAYVPACLYADQADNREPKRPRSEDVPETSGIFAVFISSASARTANHQVVTVGRPKIDKCSVWLFSSTAKGRDSCAAMKDLGTSVMLLAFCQTSVPQHLQVSVTNAGPVKQDRPR